MEIELINPTRKIPFKTYFASFSLTIFGFFLLSLSIFFYINHNNHEGFLPLLIISIKALVPGIYSLTIIIGTYCNWVGYSLDSLPSYEML